MQRLVTTGWEKCLIESILARSVGVEYDNANETSRKHSHSSHPDFSNMEIHFDPASIAKAKLIAQEFGSEQTRFLSLDVFEQNLFEHLTYRPNLIIVSGLLELYENNTKAHRLFARLYQELDEGGYLVYTGQPWHPQIELIGRLLNNRNSRL